MKFLVASDSHGAFNRLFDMINAHPEIDNIIFLGDGARDIEDIMSVFESKKFYVVSGNCDLMCTSPDYNTIETSKGKILYTHGHTFGVKASLLSLRAKAMSFGACLALFGHTHIPTTDEREGITAFNPGSIKSGYYGIVEVTEKGITTAHFQL